MTNSNSTDQNNSESPSHCGSKPKKIAFGIAPLGFISIGIVPMGIVTIGIVPMGVVSIGVVAMGVVNASIVGMGIFSAGITTMGLKVWSPENNAIHESINRSHSHIQLKLRQRSKPKRSDAMVSIRWVHYGCLVQSISTLTNIEVIKNFKVVR